MLNPDTKNLVVDYGHDRAYCAIDVATGEAVEQDRAIVDLMVERPAELDSRWIAIFGPDKQKKLVMALASEYGLSPRHIHLLTSPPPEAPTTPMKDDKPPRVKGYMDIANKVYHWHAVEMGGRCELILQCRP